MQTVEQLRALTERAITERWTLPEWRSHAELCLIAASMPEAPASDGLSSETPARQADGSSGPAKAQAPATATHPAGASGAAHPQSAFVYSGFVTASAARAYVAARRRWLEEQKGAVRPHASSTPKLPRAKWAWAARLRVRTAAALRALARVLDRGSAQA